MLPFLLPSPTLTLNMLSRERFRQLFTPATAGANTDASLLEPPPPPRTPPPHRVVLLNLELAFISSAGISSLVSGTDVSLKSDDVQHGRRRSRTAARRSYHSDFTDSTSSDSEHTFDIEEDDDSSSDEFEAHIQVEKDVFVNDGDVQHVPIAPRPTITPFTKFDSRFTQSNQPYGSPYYALDPDGLITINYWADVAARNYVLATCIAKAPYVNSTHAAFGRTFTEQLRMRPEAHALDDELQLLDMKEKQIRDTSMLVEYADEIFQHMESCGLKTMPNPDYTRQQGENLSWSQRAIMIGWMVSLFDRANLMPETLSFAVNIIDRFLSLRVIAREKLNLVGVVAAFIAIKHQEVGRSRVDDLVTIMNNTWSREQILAGERIVSKALNCDMSYCSPHSWIRRISQADNYDPRTRHIAYFLLDLSLFDHRFLLLPPSMKAAVAMFLARRMIGGAWDADCVYYARFAAEQLVPAAQLLRRALQEDKLESRYVWAKYAQVEYGTASLYARRWALNNPYVPLA